MTKLNRWYDEENGIYTRDTWVIPDEGCDIWCTAWKRGQLLKPYCSGSEECFHIIVGLDVFHCDEFMSILEQNEKDGYKWGIQAQMTREQKIDGYWEKVKLEAVNHA